MRPLAAQPGLVSPGRLLLPPYLCPDRRPRQNHTGAPRRRGKFPIHAAAARGYAGPERRKSRLCMAIELCDHITYYIYIYIYI